MPRPTATAVAVAALASTLAAGCGSRSADSSNGAPTTLFEHRAEHVAQLWVDEGLLHRWRTSLVAGGNLTIEPAWGARGSLKAAFLSGWVRTATALPTSPGSGTVTWADGDSVPVRILDAQTTYEAIVNPRSGPCPTPEGRSSGCDWVTITAARRTTTTVATVRGPAQAPAWSFAVEGLARPLVRAAIEVTEPTALTPTDLAPPSRDGQRVLLGAQDVLSHTATSLTFTVGSGACDTDLRKHVLETDDLVVVGGTALTPEEGKPCNASLRLDPVTVPLRTELGTRPVVDAASGRPLLSRVTPSG